MIVDEEVVQDPERLLKVWANHFRVLAESSLSDGHGNSDEWVEKIKRLEALSYENEEYLLDVPFTSDEVSRAVHKLKKKKAPGPDGLLVEHLKAGGDYLAEEHFECCCGVRGHPGCDEERCSSASI